MMFRDTFGFGRKRLESEGTTDEPQFTHLLFSRTYACRIGRLLQRATSQRLEESGTSDAALNAGGPSVYLWEGMHRYRLFLRTPVEVIHGSEYIAEGVLAQKAIDEIGDPDQGKNGYPLESSCRRVVTRAWSNLSFDAIDATVSLVRARVKRYPARPLLLVTRLQPVTSGESSAVSTEPKKNAAVEEKRSEERREG